MARANIANYVKVTDGPQTDTSDDDYLDSCLDGMGDGTARLLIDRKIRKQLLVEYDLLNLVNEGHYYSANANSKDGRYSYKLMIDKQTGEVIIVERRFISK